MTYTMLESKGMNVLLSHCIVLGSHHSQQLVHTCLCNSYNMVVQDFFDNDKG